ncbi:MAG: DUF167 domain-containing protein [Phycisphaerales bacterium]
MGTMFQDEPAAQSSPAPGGAGGRAGAPPHTPRTGAAGAPACRIALKVVPGSRRDGVVGALGDRLKVKVSAPPEDGRANAAVCALIAEELGVHARAVSVVSGHSNPEKTLRVEGVSAGEAERRLLGRG